MKKRSFKLGLCEESCDWNAWYLLVITIVLLDSFPIYGDNGFMEFVICRPERSEGSPGSVQSMVKRRFFGCPDFIRTPSE